MNNPDKRIKCIPEPDPNHEPVLIVASSADTAVDSEMEKEENTVDPVTRIKLEPVNTYYSPDNLRYVENLAQIKQETIDYDIGDLDTDIPPFMIKLEPVRSHCPQDDLVTVDNLAQIKRATEEFDHETAIEELNSDIPPTVIKLEPVRSYSSSNDFVLKGSLTNIKQESQELDIKTDIEFEEDLFMEATDLSEFFT